MASTYSIFRALGYKTKHAREETEREVDPTEANAVSTQMDACSAKVCIQHFNPSAAEEVQHLLRRLVCASECPNDSHLRLLSRSPLPSLPLSLPPSFLSLPLLLPLPLPFFFFLPISRSPPPSPGHWRTSALPLDVFGCVPQMPPCAVSAT